MKFKEWIFNEIRYKGLANNFYNQFPEMPKYVANQLYNNRVAPKFSKMIRSYTGNSVSTNDTSALAPTIIGSGDDAQFTQSVSSSPRLLSADAMSDVSYQNINWAKEPQIIEVHPLNFDNRTTHLFLQWRYGFNPHNNSVRNDTERFELQRQKSLNTPVESYEPVIVVREGNKYSLLEGFHRTMIWLLGGAPEDQIDLLKNGTGAQGLDYRRWAPVKIKAFVGDRVADKEELRYQWTRAGMEQF